MHLRESILIAADAATIWPLVADPVRHAEWDPKVISIDRLPSGPVRLGERFKMLHRMSGREDVSEVEVTACNPPARVTFQHRTIHRGAQQIIEEHYGLTPCPGGVRLAQTIDLTRAGLPWPFLILIWIIQRFVWSASALACETSSDWRRHTPPRRIDWGSDSRPAGIEFVPTAASGPSNKGLECQRSEPSAEPHPVSQTRGQADRASDPHAGRPILTAGPPPERADGVIVLVHGRGATAQSMLDWYDELAIPGLSAVAPEAAGNTWYPQSFLAPLEANQPYLGGMIRPRLPSTGTMVRPRPGSSWGRVTTQTLTSGRMSG